MNYFSEVINKISESVSDAQNRISEEKKDSSEITSKKSNEKGSEEEVEFSDNENAGNRTPTTKNELNDQSVPTPPLAQDEMEDLMDLLTEKLVVEPVSNTPKIKHGTLQEVADLIKNGHFKKIVVMTGAGISTSAGIPDFRSPKTGLYHNLQKFKLPYAEAIFDIDYFRDKPEPFYELAKELYPGNFQPTATHYFIKLLNDKNLLLRNYTQNIDALERLAGIDDEVLVEAHGSFFNARCIEKNCDLEYKHSTIRDAVMRGEVPKCTKCKKGLVKPDIVFFGEGLPQKFFDLSTKDLRACDLLIVMGTSLTVHPFASLIQLPHKNVPRILINRDKVGMSMHNGFDFSNKSKKYKRDIWFKGNCDERILEFVKHLGWHDDLSQLMKNKKK